MNIESIQQLGLMAYPLILCSVVMVAIILEKLLFLLRGALFFKHNEKKLNRLLNQYKEHNKEIRDEFINIELNQLKIQYLRGVKLLKMIGTIAPLLGLLGTILGIISAFKVIAAHNSHVSPNMIASGLWEAMLTTATGLIIAIPALVFAYLFIAITTQRLQKIANNLGRDSLMIEVNRGAL